MTGLEEHLSEIRPNGGFPLSPKAYISNSSHCPISKYQANHKKNPNRTLASVAMASMQCYKPSNECSQPKSKDNSLVHKAAEMASCALKGNQQGHCATPAHGHGQHKDKGHHASNGMACHGKSTEKKMKEKKSEHKKEKSVTKKKSKESHRSCNDSDSSSSSGSDSD
nr:hypothetical protein CFP56_23362 [Quercus suber]